MSDGSGARTWGGWVVTSAVVGIVAGMVWAVVAPRAEFRVSGGEFFRVAAQPEEYFLGDLVLGVLLAVAGAALAGWWWWRLRQRRPMASLIGLVTGGVVALSLAVVVGQGLAGGPASAVGLADGVVVRAGLEFRSWAMVVWWPTVVAVLFAVALAGGTRTDAEVSVSAAPGDGSGTS